MTLGLGDLLFRGVTVTGFWLTRWLEVLGSERAATLGKLMDLMAQGVIVPHSGRLPPEATVRAPGVVAAALMQMPQVQEALTGIARLLCRWEVTDRL